MSSSLLNTPSLNVLYSPSQWSSRLTHEDIVARHMKVLLDATLTSRLLLNPRLSLDNSYSDGPLSKYDVYFPFKEYVSSLTPILIYIHGGYWTMMNKEYSGKLMIIMNFHIDSRSY